jgi:hypothetical protein
MKLPDGVVGLRKVKTVLGGEDGHTHLTWVLAYNAGIEVGSERYEAIRAFAGGLKAPLQAGRRMEHSVMFLPIAPPDTSQAPPPSERPAAPRKSRRARPKKRLAPKSRTKPSLKRPAKTVAKTAVRPPPRAAIKRAAKTRRPAPARARPRTRR